MKNLFAFKVSTFTVEPQHYRMLRRQEVVVVSKRLMNLLVVLAAHPGEIITKDQLLNEVWGEVIVSDETVRKSVSDLRQFFANAGDKIEIESVRGVGYRLLTPIVPVTSTSDLPTRPDSRWLPWAKYAAGLLTCLLLLGGLRYWRNADKAEQKSNSEITFDSKRAFWHPTFTKDGQRLAFITKSNRAYELRVLDYDAGEEKVLFSAPSMMQAPSWSDDGRYLAFVLEGSEPGLAVFDCENNSVRPLGKGEHPSWLPDSYELLFTAIIDGERTILQQSSLPNSIADTIMPLAAWRVVSDGQYWYYSKEAEHGLWKYDPINNTDHKIVEDFDPKDVANWTLRKEQLIFWERAADQFFRPFFQMYDVNTGTQSTLDSIPGFCPFFYTGFAVHPIEDMIIYPRRRYLERAPGIDG